MSTYIASKGDTWDSIAFKVYSDEFMCDALCAANVREFEGVVVFDGGESVYIPETVSRPIDVIKAPWE